MTALGDDATVPKILITLYVIRVGKGLNAYSSAACALTYQLSLHTSHAWLRIKGFLYFLQTCTI